MVTLQIAPQALLLDRHAVAELFKCSEDTIKNLVRDSTSGFPQPFKMGNYKSTPLWRIEDLKKWIDERYKEQNK